MAANQVVRNSVNAYPDNLDLNYCKDSKDLKQANRKQHHLYRDKSFSVLLRPEIWGLVLRSVLGPWKLEQLDN